jgi:Cytochrome c7 and related cytochrome c
MQLVTYESHCRACHPLTLEPVQGDQPAIEVVHGQSPEMVHQRLTEDYLGRYLADQGSILDAKVESVPLPGKLPAEQTVPVRNVINARVLAAEKTLYQGQQSCALCHEVKPTGGDLAEALAAGQAPHLDIVKTDVPTVWYKSAKFNHTAHQSMQCRDCHASAYPDSPTASSRSSDGMIPGMANCVQCHAPRSAQSGGARYDCTECHQYHGREVNSGLLRLGIKSFILGSSPKNTARTHSP